MQAKTPTESPKRLRSRPEPHGRTPARVRALALALACIGSPAARAAEDEPSLEELLRVELPRQLGAGAVSTASRLAQRSELAPAVTHVVTRQDIERLGLRSFSDVLRRLPGLHARDSREFARVSVRGFGPGDFNGRVLFLIDGIRLNENIYDAGQISLDFVVDVSLIERVEFMPGPGSALYGGNALLGVVNVVTQRADRTAGPQLQLGFGGHARKDGRLSYGQRLDDGSEWLMAYSFALVPRERQLVSTLQPFEDETRSFDRDRAQRSLLTWRSGGFHARALSVNRVRSLPAYVEELDAFRQSSDQTYIRILQTGWDTRLGEDWDLSLALTVQQQRYRFDEPLFRAADRPLDVLRFEALGRWAIGELRLGREWIDDHYLLGGLEWQRDWKQRFRFAVVGGAHIDQPADGQRAGLFLQDEWRLSPQQRLVAGVRADHQAAWRWSPRLAWTWSEQPGQSLKLLWGQAFRPANRFETGTNEDLGQALPRPEGLRSLELAAEQPLGEGWQLRGSVYGMRLLRPIEGQDDGHYENGIGERLQGLDLGTVARWAGGWQLQLDLSQLRVRQDDGGRLNFVARRQLKWALQMPLGEHLRLGWHGWAQSRRPGDGAAVHDLPGYAVHNLHLGWQLEPKLQLFAGVQNLGGRRWVEPRSAVSSRSVFAHQGEQWQLGVQWRP